jgi:hypothetical protein
MHRLCNSSVSIPGCDSIEVVLLRAVTYDVGHLKVKKKKF